ncbi:MAG: Sigma 54 modulation protein / ribosomal protein [Candidatus Parcubacteria bacterium]|jgi:ribosomal subunit interface protein
MLVGQRVSRVKVNGLTNTDMTFPTINFKFNDLNEAQALADVVEQKCITLGKYIHDHQAVTCDIEFEKVAPQQNGQVHRVEVNLQVDGTLFRAVATEESFEKAIDEVREELDRELRKAKERQETLMKQGGREAKAQMLEVE